jgi:aldehyde dehydrogenase (NAD+)
MEQTLDGLLERQRAFFATGATLSESFRRNQLQSLRKALAQEQRLLAEALRADLGKPDFEILTSEIGFVLREVDRALSRLSSWCKPARVPTPMLLWPGKSQVAREPFGPVLIMSPWNQPLQISLLPAIAAIAAGNTVVLKPSEYAPKTGEAIAQLVNSRFPAELFHVVTGDAEVAAALAALPFSYLFFTGGAAVGRRVYQAAAANLCPVTLELGGKNPCVVREDAKLGVAARRIVHGKLFNAGQACIAPDTVYVHASVKGALLEELRSAIERSYGPDPSASRDYGRIVNQQHCARLAGLLADAKIYCGGQQDPAARYFAPTVVDGVAEGSLLASEEIFGPILPVVAYADDAVLDRLLRRTPMPLAFYVFTEDRTAAHALRRRHPAGGFVINDTISQVMNPDLPFGGVGTSGMGSYRGDEGWRTFTRPVAVLDRSTRIDPRFSYPPHSHWKIASMRKRLARIR